MALHEFYLVVHGDTAANAEGLLCGGGWDLPLSDLGIRQAKELSKFFAKKNHPSSRGVRVIFSSPLLRCIQTTDVLHDQLKVKVRVISGLAERGLGLWEKKSAAEVHSFSPTIEQIPGGENLNRFRARVQESLNYILDNSTGPPLLVTHGIFAATLLGLLGLAERKVESCKLYRFSRPAALQPWELELMESA